MNEPVHIHQEPVNVREMKKWVTITQTCLTLDGTELVLSK